MTWLDYYFFTVETMTTIGYGAYHVDCHSINFCVSFIALHGCLLDAFIFGIVMSKVSAPLRRGCSMLISDCLCGHLPSGTVAFRMMNPRTKPLYDPKMTVYLLTPRPQEMPIVEVLETRSSAPIDFIQWPLVFAVDLRNVMDLQKKFLMAIFLATDSATGNMMELRYTWSLNANIQYGFDFAPIYSNSFSRDEETMESGTLALDVDRFQEVVPSECPAWVVSHNAQQHQLRSD
jgi:hypothetical protein